MTSSNLVDCMTGIRRSSSCLPAAIGIDQDGNDHGLCVQQPEQLNAFRSKLAIDKGHASDIAARPVEADHQPVLNRLAAVCEHDRNARRRSLGGDRGDYASCSKDCIDRTFDSAARAGSLSY
jgi:hypothetical protein